jgi:hypothetical protein
MATHATLAALLMASLFVSGPLGPSEAEARPGEKRWNPKHGNGGGRRAERLHRREAAPRHFNRQWRSWRGQRIYRDVIVIRSGGRGPRYRAWRAYSRPQYIYSRRIIRVRPVRFYVSASAIIGGLHIRGAYRDHDDYLYGCNFCEARFEAYPRWHTHVLACPHRPSGYRVECSDWDAPASGDWWDDRDWRDDDGGYHDGRDRDDHRDRAYDRDDGRWEDEDDR